MVGRTVIQGLAAALTGRMRLTASLRALLSAALIVSLLSCAGDPHKKAIKSGFRDPDTVRYRLLLRDNHVDKGEAFRCYGACQKQTTPKGYVECLMDCPGSERDPGFMCADYEVPPVAACLTVRKVDADDELDPALIVLANVAGVALVVGLSSVCAATSSPSNCMNTYSGSW